MQVNDIPHTKHSFSSPLCRPYTMVVHKGKGLWTPISRSCSPVPGVTLHSLQAVKNVTVSALTFNLDIPVVFGEWYQTAKEEARRKVCKLGKKKRGNCVVIWIRPRLILWLAEGTRQSSWQAMIWCAVLGSIFLLTSLFTSPPPLLPPLLLCLTSALSLP